jgi:3',5'-cyclic AMP phosphodiesterase CpdA
MFAVSGDNRATGRGVPAPPTSGQIFSELRLLQPAFCLWTGDTIYGSEDSMGEARAEYDRFLRSAAAADVPIINAPGNHEIHKSAEREALYREKMGELYGSFDYGRCHFIALDTEEAAGPIGIGPAPKEWLRSDLSANRKAAAIVVFMHHPLFPKRKGQGFAETANRDEIHRLFVEYGVKYVFAGHEHLFCQSVHDGVHYVVTGGAGAPSEGSPEEGGFQNYLLVYVAGDGISIVVLEPWRLFLAFGPVSPNGSCSARIDNYHDADLSVLVQFPTDAIGSRASASAALDYKGWTHPLAASIVPPRHPGTTAVLVTVPRARSVLTIISPAKK